SVSNLNKCVRSARLSFLEIRRMTMSVLHSLFGRRHFLASTLVGTLGVFLPMTAAHAQTARPSPAGAEIRPFKFHASDQSLADLRRRIAATKWPSPELVTDAS